MSDTDQQPSIEASMVRKILDNHWKHAVTGKFSTIEAAYQYHEDMTDEAEAAINNLFLTKEALIIQQKKYIIQLEEALERYKGEE